MGIHYTEIESHRVGFEDGYEMHSMDFEEFLWAKGYKEEFIEELSQHMLEVRPLPSLQLEVLFSLFRDDVTAWRNA